jgi:hypothetical protein
MRNLILSLMLLASTAEAGIKSDGTPASAGSTRDFIDNARAKGLKILSEAYAETNNSTWKVHFSRTYHKLKGVVIHWPNPGREYQNCTGSILAFSSPNTNDIYVCRRVIDGDAWQINEVAQTLIHQAAFTTGMCNLCDAAKIEVAAMRLSSLGAVAYRNGFLDRCGIE